MLTRQLEAAKETAWTSLSIGLRDNEARMILRGEEEGERNVSGPPGPTCPLC
jgi:hypothetical protein